MTCYAISPAQLDWIVEDNVEIPVSRQFGDVYFSRANGLAETRHVFLQGNDLSTRLAALSSHQYFCVGETGFGTGLNILALWQLWQQCRPDNHSRLHVVTVEKFPLTRADLQRALAAWPELASLSQQLIAQYPPALPGCHRLIFAHERFSIDLWLGDAADCLAQVHSQHPVDAWFLDGFAPKCNPELWQDNVLSQIVRLSGYGSSFASFSVAGVVKQGLRAYGIHVTRPRGFGHKREMLKARWLAPNGSQPDPSQSNGSQPDACRTGISQPAPPSNPHPLPRIAIIGAGIAGLSLAHALALRGYGCDLYDQTAPLAGASGNPRALLAPKLVHIAKFSSNLLNLGSLFSMRYWQQFNGVIEKIGILHILDKRATQELDKASAYPDDVVCGLTPEQTTALTGKAIEFNSLWLKQAGLLNPQALAELVLQDSAIQYCQLDISQILPNGIQWQLKTATNEILSASYDHVLICTAINSPLLCHTLPALKPIRGQVSWFKTPVTTATDCSEQPTTPPVPLPLTYGGYMAQIQSPDAGTTVLLGASFVRQDNQSDIRLADHQHNLELIQAIAPCMTVGFPATSTWQGRAAIRAQTRDYLPLAGAVTAQPGIWTLSGLGSKGFSYAPLCAEILCAQLLGEVYPVSEEVIQSIQPARFKKSLT